MDNHIDTAKLLVIKEFRQVEKKLIRVWDILGYNLIDEKQERLLRWPIEGGVVVRVRSLRSQKAENLFRIKSNEMRPRWKVRLTQPTHHITLRSKQIWIRAPSIHIETGERENKFRYLIVNKNE